MRVNKLIYSKDEIDHMQYLKRYSKIYWVKENESQTMEIQCLPKNSHRKTVSVHNFPLNSKVGGNILNFTIIGKNALNYLFTRELKLKNLGVWYEIISFGAEFSLIFKESDLKKVEDIFKIRKKTILSEEQKEKLKKQLHPTMEVTT